MELYLQELRKFQLNSIELIVIQTGFNHTTDIHLKQYIRILYPKYTLIRIFLSSVTLNSITIEITLVR